MTTKNKFTLVTKDEREPVLMKRTGERFEYSDLERALQGKRILEGDRKVSLVVVPL